MICQFYSISLEEKSARIWQNLKLIWQTNGQCVYDTSLKVLQVLLSIGIFTIRMEIILSADMSFRLCVTQIETSPHRGKRKFSYHERKIDSMHGFLQ